MVRHRVLLSLTVIFYKGFFPASVRRLERLVLGEVISDVFTVCCSPSMSKLRVAPSLRTSMVTGAPMTIGTHHKRKVHVIMSGREAAEDGDVIPEQIFPEHLFAVFKGELRTAVREFAQNNALAAVQDTVHLKDIELSVDVVHGFLHLFDEKDDIPFGSHSVQDLLHPALEVAPELGPGDNGGEMET